MHVDPYAFRCNPATGKHTRRCREDTEKAFQKLLRLIAEDYPEIYDQVQALLPNYDGDVRALLDDDTDFEGIFKEEELDEDSHLVCVECGTTRNMTMCRSRHYRQKCLGCYCKRCSGGDPKALDTMNLPRCRHCDGVRCRRCKDGTCKCPF